MSNSKLIYVGNPYLPSRIWEVTKDLLMHADTTTVRLILSLSSLLFAIGLVCGSMYQHPPFAIMRDIAPAYVWSILFFLHFVGLSWRFLDPVPRIFASVIINSFGFVIWVVSTISINLAYANFAPGTSVEVVLCLFAAWALVRTGMTGEFLSP